jgi:hypothetical protein
MRALKKKVLEESGIGWRGLTKGQKGGREPFEEPLNCGGSCFARWVGVFIAEWVYTCLYLKSFFNMRFVFGREADAESWSTQSEIKQNKTE